MKKFLAILFTVSLATYTCSDLDVENVNQADRERALKSDADVTNLINGSTTSIFYRLIGFHNIYTNQMSDQTTTTNAYRDFWAFGDQPRREMNNASTNGNLSTISSNWSDFNSQIYNANTLLDLVNNKGRVILNDNDEDVTDHLVITSKFIRGMSQGYIGLLYDKGYIVDENTDPAILEFSTYEEMINSGLEDLQDVLNNTPSNYELRLYEGYNINRDDFIKLVNTYMAKFIMGKARTSAETVDYNKALTHINNGITADFNPPAKQNILFNNGQDWMCYTLSGGAGYIPVDQKIPYLSANDPVTQPADYPTDTTVLGQATSSDPRFAQYFGYTTSFGYLNPTRGRELFSNYFHKRFKTANNRNVDGYSTNIFSLAELQYLKAEAQYKSGDFAGAATTLNGSPRYTVGNITTLANDAEIKKALLYEYAIELHLNGSLGNNYFFMRRNDLLQKGTPTNFPVPASELEITGDMTYTFGGEANAGQDGSASGTNSWKTL